MKRKQRIKMALLLVVISITIVGIIGGKRMNEPTEKEKQIAFLKAHEEELIEYIKKYSSQDEQINFNWETTTENKDIAFSKPTLIVKFDISGSSESKYNNQGYVLRVKTDLKKLNKISELTVLNDPIYSNIQEDINGRFRK